MPKIIFQPLMISNPPGRLTGLRSCFKSAGTPGGHEIQNSCIAFSYHMFKIP